MARLGCREIREDKILQVFTDVVCNFEHNFQNRYSLREKIGKKGQQSKTAPICYLSDDSKVGNGMGSGVYEIRQKLVYNMGRGHLYRLIQAEVNVGHH